MATNYPTNIDNNITLPQAVDLITPVQAEVVNRLRDAIIAIEAELGIDPSREYATVRARLDALAGGGGGGGASVDIYHEGILVVPTVEKINFTGSVDVSSLPNYEAVVDIVGAEQRQESFVATAGQLVFILSEQPLDATAVQMFINGAKQRYGFDYTALGTSVSYISGDYTIQNGDIIEFWYVVNGIFGGGGGGSSDGYITIIDESTVISSTVNTLRFIGDGVVATDAGGTVVDITIVGEQSLSEVLAVGNTTDGYDIEFTSGDNITMAGNFSMTSAAGTGASITLSSGSSTTGSGGDISLSTGGSTNPGSRSGRIILSTANDSSTGDGSGDINIRTGTTNSSNSGSLTLSSGSTSGTATSSGGASFSSGNCSASTGTSSGYVTIKSGHLSNAANVGTTGSILISSGRNYSTNIIAHSGPVGLASGPTNGVGGISGEISLISGIGRSTGRVYISSGDSESTTGDSGDLILKTGAGGTSNPGTSGDVDISTTGAYSSGDISLTCGASTGAAGGISITGGTSSGIAGGSINITAGSSSAGAGGDLSLYAGNSGGANIGGDILLKIGLSGAGNGHVKIGIDPTLGSNNSLFQNYGDGYFNGNLEVTGKLTVGGLIDPTGLVLVEQATVPGGSPAIGSSTLWIRDSDGYAILTDSNGIDTVLNGGGGGSVPSTQTLAQTLALGNSTGGTSINFTSGDNILLNGDFSLSYPNSGSGSITINSQNSTTGVSGAINIHTGTSADGFKSGNISLLTQSGWPSGHSGDISVASGPGAAGSGRSGSITVNTGVGSGSGSGNLSVYTGEGQGNTSGNLDLYTGTGGGIGSGSVSLYSGQENNGSGAVNVYTGNSAFNPSGQVNLYSGNNFGVSTSGNVSLYSGTGNGGSSGNASLYTGTSGAANTGLIEIFTGEAIAATSGTISIRTGYGDASGSVSVSSGDGFGATTGTASLYSGNNSAAGTSGNALIYTGTSALGSTGFVSIETGDSASDSSGAISIQTGVPAFGFKGGNISLLTQSGGGHSGDVSVASGSGSGSGRSGAVTVNTGAGNASGSGNLLVYTGDGQGNTSGDLALYSGSGGGTGSGSVSLYSGQTSQVSGALNLYTGVSSGGAATGAANLYSGNNLAAGVSGNVSLYSGTANVGASGNASIYTGTSTSGNTGFITMYTGDGISATSETGDIYIYTGVNWNASNTDATGSLYINTGDNFSTNPASSSGNIFLETGSSSGGSGSIFLTAKAGAVSSGNITLSTILDGDINLRTDLGDINLRTDIAGGVNVGLINLEGGHGTVTGGPIRLYGGPTTGIDGMAGSLYLWGGEASSGFGGEIQIYAGLSGNGHRGGNISIQPGPGNNESLYGQFRIGQDPQADEHTQIIIDVADGYTLFQAYGDGYFDGDLEVTGKLTVGGLIDPTGLVLDVQTSVPGGTPATGKSTLWVRDSDGYAILTDENGNDVVLSGGGGGGGSQTLAQTLVLGNSTEGNNLDISIDDELVILGPDGYISMFRDNDSGYNNQFYIAGAGNSTGNVNGAGEAISIRAGNGFSTATGSVLNLFSGDFDNAINEGGSCDLSGGFGFDSGSGGAASIVGGAGGETGNGGDVRVLAGSGGFTSGNGGSVIIEGGSANPGNGGDVNINAGAGVANGNVNITGTNIVLTGDAEVTGKLTVAGLIDPTGLVLDVQASVPGGTPVAGKSTLWIRQSDGYVVVTDENGDDAVLAGGSGTGSSYPSIIPLLAGIATNDTSGWEVVGMAEIDSSEFTGTAIFEAILSSSDGIADGYARLFNATTASVISTELTTTSTGYVLLTDAISLTAGSNLYEIQIKVEQTGTEEFVSCSMGRVKVT